MALQFHFIWKQTTLWQTICWLLSGTKKPLPSSFLCSNGWPLFSFGFCTNVSVYIKNGQYWQRSVLLPIAALRNITDAPAPKVSCLCDTVCKKFMWSLNSSKKPMNKMKRSSISPFFMSKTRGVKSFGRAVQKLA